MRAVLWLLPAVAVLCVVAQESREETGTGPAQAALHDQHNSSLRLQRENTNFALRLFKLIAAQPKYQYKNVFFSPLSVSTALAALSLGARGLTHQDLFSGLGFNVSDLTQEEVHQGFHEILQNLRQKKLVDVKAGNGLFVSDQFKPHSEFLENVKELYFSEGFTTDFTKTPEAVHQINNYVKDKTVGKISDLVENLDPATAMYLVSYIYFKGKWDVPFDPKDTVDDTFNVNESTTVRVKMMRNQDEFDVFYDQTLSTQVLMLQYSESVSMMLALPDDGLEALEKAVSPEHVAKWHRWMKKKECIVTIPKLSIKTSYPLKDVLGDMGFKDIFSRSANFTGISEGPLFLSEVVHKATLDVDEAGATATAATGVQITLLSYRPMGILKFDRPFLVVIFNQDTKSILFLGKIVNPKEK
uniref:Thyroxine-binding globulin n=1 Tax=Denticeps clupeoides TaxID=299321 RepID=A0AAY4AS94_9TELE